MLNFNHNPSSSAYRVQAQPVTDSRGAQLKETHKGEQYNVMLKRSNSNWNMQAEQQAAHNAAALKHPNRTTAGIQLAANALYGAAYEAHVGRALNRDSRFTDVQDQVRLVPKPAGQPYSTQELKDLSKEQGATLRTDFLAELGGKFKNIECKSSNTAGYTSNQQNMLDDIKHDGAIVVSGRGNYAGGEDLGKVSTITVRPSTEDDVFAKETLERAAPPPPKRAPVPDHPVYGRRW